MDPPSFPLPPGVPFPPPPPDGPGASPASISLLTMLAAEPLSAHPLLNSPTLRSRSASLMVSPCASAGVTSPDSRLSLSFSIMRFLK